MYSDNTIGGHEFRQSPLAPNADNCSTCGWPKSAIIHRPEAGR